MSSGGVTSLSSVVWHLPPAIAIHDRTSGPGHCVALDLFLDQRVVHPTPHHFHSYLRVRSHFRPSFPAFIHTGADAR